MAPRQRDGSLTWRHIFNQSQTSSASSCQSKDTRRFLIKIFPGTCAVLSSQDRWLLLLLPLPPTRNIFLLADSPSSSFFFRNLELFLRSTRSGVLVHLKLPLVPLCLNLACLWSETKKGEFLFPFGLILSLCWEEAQSLRSSPVTYFIYFVFY